MYRRNSSHARRMEIDTNGSSRELGDTDTRSPRRANASRISCKVGCEDGATFAPDLSVRSLPLRGAVPRPCRAGYRRARANAERSKAGGRAAECGEGFTGPARGGPALALRVSRVRAAEELRQQVARNRHPVGALRADVVDGCDIPAERLDGGLGRLARRPGTEQRGLGPGRAHRGRRDASPGEAHEVHDTAPAG